MQIWPLNSFIVVIYSITFLIKILLTHLYILTKFPLNKIICRSSDDDPLKIIF